MKNKQETTACLPLSVLQHTWLTNCLYLILGFCFHWYAAFLDCDNFTCDYTPWFKDDSDFFIFESLNWFWFFLLAFKI